MGNCLFDSHDHDIMESVKKELSLRFVRTDFDIRKHPELSDYQVIKVR